jgi:uncharacterized protein (DUF1697 family)
LNTYIAMLRGVNVSGKNMIKMPLLAKAMEQMGLQNVRSYIQSGNLVFRAPLDQAADLGEQIRALIKKDFGFDVPVLVIDADTLILVRDENPFLNREETDLTKLHVTFLASVPDEDRLAMLDPEKFLPDIFTVNGSTIYIYCPGGYGNTKLTNNLFESKFKVVATTRNWNTVNKLVELAGS